MRTAQQTIFLNILLALIVLSIFVLSQSVFIVGQTEQAMVIQFGHPVQRYTTPGLKFKIPLIQQVRTFDSRLLDVDPEPEEVILSDQKRVVVDTFARYRITDMLAFFRALSTEEQANSRLNNIINSAMRSTLGDATLDDLLSKKRDQLMARIRDQVNASVKHMGIDIVDVRIGRADLPVQTSQSIYARMKTERQREAAQFRAQGHEQAQEIKSKADKERTILLAEAQKQADILRGEGDEDASRIYAAAYDKDPSFYAFYRTMQAYKASLAGHDTTLVLPANGDFLHFLKSGSGGK